MYPGRPRVGQDCWIEHKNSRPPRVVLRRAPRMYVVYTAQALPSPRDCRPNQHWGDRKNSPSSSTMSLRWPTGAVCTRGSALHNVSRAHSRWVLRSRWKGSHGLPVQSEVPSGHLRQLDYASPTLPRAGGFMQPRIWTRNWVQIHRFEMGGKGGARAHTIS